MAHTKAGGSTKLGRDSASKRLGVKLFGGQLAKAGQVVVRQRGQSILAGTGAAIGKDYTIHAARSGRVSYTTRRIAKFNGHRVRQTVVEIID